VGPDITLPTDEERAAALASFNRGEFGPMEEYLKRALAWHLEASRDTFNRETFIKGRQAQGKNPDEAEIRRMRRFLDEHFHLPFKKSAARDAHLLGKLLAFQLRYKEALAYFQQAVKLAPNNAEYAADLAKAKADAKARKRK
jgi:tetratricopeptide (TPR) repeat protein